jgi:hypothetical protein
MSPLVDFVVFCCHSVHIGVFKPLHEDSLLRKIYSLLCSTIFHWKIVQINCCKRNAYHEGESLVYVFGFIYVYGLGLVNRTRTLTFHPRGKHCACKLICTIFQWNIFLNKESSWRGLNSPMCTEWQQNTTKSTNGDIRQTLFLYANFSDI